MKSPITINAFHKDFVRTFYPDLLASIKLNSDQVAQGKVNGAKSRATRETTHGRTVNTINVFPKTQNKR